MKELLVSLSEGRPGRDLWVGEDANPDCQPQLVLSRRFQGQLGHSTWGFPGIFPLRNPTIDGSRCVPSTKKYTGRWQNNLEVRQKLLPWQPE